MTVTPIGDELSFREQPEIGKPSLRVLVGADDVRLAGVGDDLAETYRRALGGDPQSAFGGVIALSRPAGQPLRERQRTLLRRGSRLARPAGG